MIFKKKTDEKSASIENTEAKNRKKLRRKTYIKVLLKRFVVLLMVLLLCIYGFVGLKVLDYARELLDGKPTIKINDFIGEESSRIYDGEGNLLTEIGTYYRENIKYDKCPESLIDAFLSIEDSRYFEHNGFDIPRFSKSAIETLLRRNTQGGSTFTMQLVKNTYFTIDAGDDSVSYTADYQYKAQQIWLSMELEQYLTKKEIFELYVNKLNFGSRVRGVQKAADYYFNKDTSQLNLSESAMLAGIVNLPNQFNPYMYLDIATNRRNQVLDLMLSHGYITEDEHALATSIKVEDLLVGEENFTVESTKYPAYIDAVIEEAEALTGFDPVNVGMEIHTGLIPEVQEEIESILNADSSVPYTKDLMQCAIVSMNNNDGTIVGIGGGRNYKGGSRLLNRATQGYKQPGSCLKPIIPYLLSFEYLGYSLDEILEDRPITYPGESRVLRNADGNYTGDVTIRDAHIRSLNIPAIMTLQRVVEQIGSQAVVDYMKSIGFTSIDYENFHLSVAIGGNDFVATPKQVAGAHAAIMNLGVYNEPHTITRLVTSNEEIYYPDNQNVRVVSSGSAYLSTQLLKGNVDTTLYNYTNVLKRGYPVYAKTGTTDWGSDGLQYGIPSGAMKDKWMVSSTNTYTNAVWLGFDMAVAGKATYVNDYEMNLNIPGIINNRLLSIEEGFSNDNLYDGVSKPNDLKSVTFVKGSWPHVQRESWMPGNAFVTTYVSTTGLKNSPLIPSSQYSVTKPKLTGITASASGTTLKINWGNNSRSCSGSTKDISLHDQWNNISKTGVCLVDLSWLGGGARYVAEIYANGAYVTTVTSNTASYSGNPGVSGSIRVCGYYSNSAGTSEKKCAEAGTLEAVKKEDSSDEKDTSSSDSSESDSE